MMIMVLGYRIHNFINDAQSITPETFDEEVGVATFIMATKAVVNTGDYIIKMSLDGTHKTLWRITACSPIAEEMWQARAVDLMKMPEEIEKRMGEAIRMAERNQ